METVSELRFEQAYRNARNRPDLSGFYWRGAFYRFDRPKILRVGLEIQADLDRKAREKALIDELCEQPWGPVPIDTTSPPAGRMDTKAPIDCLMIQRTENGGWLVMSQMPHGIRADYFGAFTDTSDMLAALEDLLHRDDAKREEG